MPRLNQISNEMLWRHWSDFLDQRSIDELGHDGNENLSPLYSFGGRGRMPPAALRQTSCAGPIRNAISDASLIDANRQSDGSEFDRVLKKRSEEEVPLR